MLTFKPWPYQVFAWRHIIEHPSSGLFLEMGLGKTVITLSAVNELMFDRFEVGRVLVIAPLRVAATVWAEEAQKWEHLQRLRVVKVLGSVAQRVAALQEAADIYVINRENVDWLVRYCTAFCKKWLFDMVVIDELSGFKNASSVRFKALRRVRPAIKRIVGLTGTPAPNGLIDLWAQVFLLDGGQRLGRTLGAYRQAFFTEGRRNAQVVFEWLPKPGAEEEIYGRLGDICVSMRNSDYVALPERLDRVVDVELPDREKTVYDALEREFLVSLRDGAEITAQNAAVVAGKLLQLANGAIYDAERNWHEIHGRKLDALADLVEAANGHPVLVYYAYQHDAERIEQRLPGVRRLITAQDVKDWNAGRIPVLLAHPDSAGHGLNLQQGGHIMVWFGLTWSLEKYQQANARLHRQGQGQPVTVYHIVAKGTIDEQVMQILAKKERRQDALIEAVKARL